MYITVCSTKRNIGFKGVEIIDIIVGLPLFFILLFLFSFKSARFIAVILLVITIFLFLPINLSKKNRMYKIIYLVFSYLKRKKTYLYFKSEKESKLNGRKLFRSESCKFY